MIMDSSTQGGQGADLPSRGELVLAGRAIRQRWPITDNLRELLTMQMEQVLLVSDHERNRIAAAKVLLEADKINMEQEKRDQGITDKIEVSGSLSHDVSATHEHRFAIDPIAFAAFVADVEAAGSGSLSPDGHLQPSRPGDAPSEAGTVSPA